jgi:uncharacterized membrane protein
MTAFVKLYLSLIVLLVGADLLWLGVVMKNFYRANMGHIIGGDVVWPAAILFYLIFTTGLLYFAIIPGIESGVLLKTVLMGMGFGLVAYATYDLTNQATIPNWPTIITVVDLVWGAFLSGILSLVAFYLHRFLS